MGCSRVYSFFDSIRRIASPSYVPTYTDLFYLRKHARDFPKKGISVSKVKITLPHLQYNFMFCAGSPGSKLSVREWTSALENNKALVFLVDLPCCFRVREEPQHPHDLVEDDYLDDTVAFFTRIINSCWLSRCAFILVFSDVQALRDQVESTIPGTKWNALHHIITQFDKQIDQRSGTGDIVLRKVIAESRDYVQEITSVIQDIIIGENLAAIKST